MNLFGGVIPIKEITFLMFAIFAIIVVGFAIGRITVKGVSLGDAGVFIIALVFGCLFYGTLSNQMTIKATTDYPNEYAEFVEFYEMHSDTPLTEKQLDSITLNEDKSNKKEVKENQIELLADIGVDVETEVNYADKALKIVENLGLVLFVTSVGFIAGPKFFGNFKKNFKSYVVLALVVILAGGLAAVGCIYFGRFVMGETNHEEFTAMIVGLLSGSLTSTPAFSAAKATVSAAYEDAVSVGHGIAYIFGVIGVVLFVQIIPKLTRADMDVERAKLNAASATNGKEEKKEEKEKKKFKLLDLDGHGFAAFALAAVIGTFVGMIKIPLTSEGLSGNCFSLTTTGGCLLTSLVFGHFAHIGPVNVTPKDSTLKIFKELGLILFLVGAGIAGGSKFIALFRFSYFVYGIVMTVVPMILGYIFAKYVLKLSLLNNLGSLTGAMTSTPALGTLIGVSKTDDVAAAYAATYPIALIAVVLVSQFLIILF